MTLVWHWPQIAMAIWLGLYVLIHAINDGKPLKHQPVRYNGSVAIIRAAVWITLLYLGGFFAGASP